MLYHETMDHLGRSSRTLTVRCAGCGAELTIEPDRRFVDCEYCHATSVVDLGGIVTCFQLRKALGVDQLKGKMGAWLREHDLKDSEATLEPASSMMIPFWVVKTSKKEHSLLSVDRADLPLSKGMLKPAGQLDHFDPDEVEKTNETDEIIDPSVPLAAALARLDLEGDDSQEQASLIYAPFTMFTYSYQGLEHQALIDASTGKVHATSWPRPRYDHLDRRLGLLLGAALFAYVGFAMLIPGVLLPSIILLVVSAPLWWALDKAIDHSKVE